MPEQQKLTIVHVTPSYKPAYCYGGPILSVARLCEATITGPYGLNCLVFTTNANGEKELTLRGENSIDGVPVFFYPRVTRDHTHFSPALLLGLHRYLRKARLQGQPIIMHIHSWWNLVAILSAILTLLHRIPLIISPRGMITNYTRTFRNTFMKRMLHLTIGQYLLKKAVLHATTSLEARDIHLNCNRNKIKVIPNLLTTAALECPDEEQETSNLPSYIDDQQVTDPLYPDLRLLFLSRIDQKKGLELLIHALSTLTFPWTLTIAGSGSVKYIRHLKQLAGSLKISGNIRWVGQIANDAKYNLMARHDLLVLPSSSENFGNVVLESLLVGTAVLISDQVGLAAYVSKRDLGWVCRTTIADVAATLICIQMDLPKRLKIRKDGAQQIRSDYSTASIMADYRKLYEDVFRQNNTEASGTYNQVPW